MATDPNKDPVKAIEELLKNTPTEYIVATLISSMAEFERLTIAAELASNELASRHIEPVPLPNATIDEAIATFKETLACLNGTRDRVQSIMFNFGKFMDTLKGMKNEN